MTTSAPEHLVLQSAVTAALDAHDLLGVLPHAAPETGYDPEMGDFVRLIGEGVAITPEVVANIRHKWFGDSWGNTTTEVEPPTSAMEDLAEDLQAFQRWYDSK